jgi:hypothetical protein
VRDLGVERAVGLEEFSGVSSVDVLHRDPQPTLELSAVVESDDVRVAQLREQIGLALEPGLEVVIAGNPAVEQLQRVLARQARVLDQEHLPHTAGAELADDRVASDLGDVHVVSVAGESVALPPPAVSVRRPRVAAWGAASHRTAPFMRSWTGAATYRGPRCHCQTAWMRSVGDMPISLAAAVRISKANPVVTLRRGSSRASVTNRQIIRSGFTPGIPASICT